MDKKIEELLKTIKFPEEDYSSFFNMTLEKVKVSKDKMHIVIRSDRPLNLKSYIILNECLNNFFHTECILEIKCTSPNYENIRESFTYAVEKTNLPFLKDRLKSNYNSYFIELNNVSEEHQCMDDILKTRTNLYSKTVDFMFDRRAHRIPVPDVVSIRTGETNHLYIEDKRGNEYSPRTTFSAICEDIADENRFLLINRGVLVNMDYISTFNDQGECILKNGKAYPVFTKKQTETVQKWQNYIFNNVRTKQRGRRKNA